MPCTSYTKFKGYTLQQFGGGGGEKTGVGVGTQPPIRSVDRGLVFHIPSSASPKLLILGLTGNNTCCFIEVQAAHRGN